MSAKAPALPDDPSKDQSLPQNVNLVLLRILNEASPELGDYYLGALHTLANTSNPDRIAQSAHSLRELIQQLPRRHKKAATKVTPPGILSGASNIYKTRDAWNALTIDDFSAPTVRPNNPQAETKYYRESKKLWEFIGEYYPTNEEERLRMEAGIRKDTPLPPKLQKLRMQEWSRYYGKFADISHHGITPTDNFDQLVEAFEDFLIRELDPQTTKDFAEISKLIKEIESGEQKSLDRLMKLVHANRPNYDYFFNNISSPVWLDILETRKLLDHIDEPYPAEEGGFYILPWVPANYYQKIVKQKPSEVIKILKAVVTTENIRAQDQILDIAKELPDDSIDFIMPQLSDWLKGRYANRGLVPFKIGDLIVSLTLAGNYDLAMQAFKALFELLEPEDTERSRYFRHPDTLTSDTSYKTLLEQVVPGLIELHPVETVRELAALLNEGLVIEREVGKEIDGIVYDGSTIWRPDIKFKQYDHEPCDILVTVIYKYVHENVKSEDDLEKIVAELRQYKFEVFHRIAATLLDDAKSKKLKDLRQEIADKIGDPSKKDFIVRESNVIPAITAGDLEKLSPKEIIDQFNNWDPKEELPGFGRSKTDIGFELNKYLATKPEVGMELLHSKTPINEEYLSHIFRGFRQASDNKNINIDWSDLINIAKKYIEKADTETSTGDERQNLFDLINALNSGVNQDHIKIQDEKTFDDLVAVFSSLTDHVEPTLDDEDKYTKGSRSEAVTLAINTMRGEALAGLIDILKNVSRNNKKKSGISKEKKNEIYKLLREKLDTGTEPTLAVRTVFSRELPFLAYDNAEWVSENLELIFPLDKAKARYFENAMETFITFTKVFPEVFPIINPYLVEYMNRIKDGEIEKPDENTVNHVVGQILLMYIDDFVDFDNPVMQKLFEMPDEFLEEAMDFFGRGIKQTEGDRQKLILEKAKKYWERRLAGGNVKESEYAKFGWWMRANAADDWIVEHFVQALGLASKMDALYFVADELVEFAKTDQAKAARVFLEIVDSQDKDNLNHMLYTPELSTMLRDMLASDDNDVKGKATRAIDKLCDMGYYNFQELIKP
ncbi:MAG TPA: hypothetical protein VLI54_06420 [Bacillota bacterium]|nr:hypothetical protein [Bacillota bacterium]